MKYKLSQAKSYVNNETKNELEKLGFSYVKEKEIPIYGDWYCKNENDLFIEINTLEKLQEFVKKYGKIVLSEDSIIIYNDYLE